MKIFLFFLVFAMGTSCQKIRSEKEFLHVSFDTSREVFRKLNQKFLDKEDKSYHIHQSHGGSSRQTGLILSGLSPDIISLSIPSDMERIADENIIPKNWREIYPHHSSPFYSVLIIVTRNGNPYGIQTWNDLFDKPIIPILPDPKTSGTGKMIFLNLYSTLLEKHGNDRSLAIKKLKEFYKRVPTGDTTSRNALTSFRKNGLGDILITWESEYFLFRDQENLSYQPVYPESSIYGEIVLSKTLINQPGETKTNFIENYIQFVFSPEAAEIITESGFRTHHESIMLRKADIFPKIHTFDIEASLGSWNTIQKEIFSASGIMNRVLQ
ncbi:MAG: sulfate ABC transporter substrate-binding protein [Leptospiraceae bacterium]|nr:sulfate ABC transporter substrate-binding protein [Leptospiraceae bacterium]MCP5512218.1 sulfate ABC transporter substrate-binding protein [Leptospiraceae bacterium]